MRRLERLHRLLGREVEILGLDMEIQNRAREQMADNQRDYYLREQLKAIQNELGEGEGGDSEIGDYRRRIAEAKLPDEVREKLEKEVGRLAKQPFGSSEATVCLLYTSSERVREKIQKLFKGYCCGDEETKRVIAAIHEKFGYLIDPHTAVGFSALSQYRAETGDETAAIVASTASPFKFCADVLDALGVSDRAQGLDVLDQLSQVTGEPVPAPLASLRSKEPRFRQTVEKEHMVEDVYKRQV